MKKQEQISIKIKKNTKDTLDRIKEFQRESYDQSISKLLELQKSAVVCNIKDHDLTWVRKKTKESFFSCPKCSDSQLGLNILSFHHLIDEYLKYGDNEKIIKSVLLNIKEHDIVNIGNIDSFLKKLKEANKKQVKDIRDLSRHLGIKSKKNFDYLGLENFEIATCYKCHNSIPFEFWKKVTKEIDMLTCPRCDCSVLDHEENKTMKFNILMCPRCHYYFDRNWEIFNHIEQKYPTIDHLRYNETTKVISIHPYECSSDSLVKLLICAKKLDYNIRILGRSEYHQNCLTIILKRNFGKK